MYLLHISILLLISNLCAAFNQIYSMKEIEAYLNIDKKKLLLFDIDNTLLMPTTDLGSDQWFVHAIHEQKKGGTDHVSALKNVLPLYFHIHHTIDLIPTEPLLADAIQLLQNYCDYGICLTARSVVLAEKTVVQLKNNGLLFKGFQLNATLFPEYEDCIYTDHVLFCGKHDKGECLLRLLDSIDFLPELIIIVDDKESNLKAVAAAAQARNIDCIALRYAGCDERVLSFNSDAAALELDMFLKKHPMIIKE